MNLLVLLLKAAVVVSTLVAIAAILTLITGTLIEIVMEVMSE